MHRFSELSRAKFTGVCVLALLVAISMVDAVEVQADESSSVSLFEPESQAWIAERIAKAKKGEREIVSVPLVHRSEGWGCICPYWYIGDSCETHSGLGWLAVETELELKPSEDGLELQVVGYFTGESESLDLRNVDGEPEEWLYQLDGFVVLSQARRADEPTLSVLLDGPEAAQTPELLGDERPWLAIAASIPLSDKKARKKAEKALSEVVQAGFDDAELIDSRQASKLSCCFLTVVAGRFASADEAEARVKALEAKKLKGYAKRGW